MSEQQLIFNDTFWKFLVSLEELQDKKDKTLFCSSLNLDEEQFLSFVEFLKRFDIACTFDSTHIYPLQEKCKVKMEFTLSEWLALQANFSNGETQFGQESFKFYYQKIIQNKVVLAAKALNQFNLYKKPTNITPKIHDIENLKKRIDYDINSKKIIKVHFYNDKECIFYPQRLVFLDGILCVVGESITDKMLVFFGLEDIKSVDEHQESYEANLSQIEINEFICHLRLINGKEERLVLKVYNQHESDLLPSYHFLGSPFVTSNTEGDMIWAATIEMCDDVFLWLYQMRNRVEILDPGHIRLEFSHYCELRKENPETKKAS